MLRLKNCIVITLLLLNLPVYGQLIPPFANNDSADIIIVWPKTLTSSTVNGYITAMSGRLLVHTLPSNARLIRIPKIKTVGSLPFIWNDENQAVGVVAGQTSAVGGSSNRAIYYPEDNMPQITSETRLFNCPDGQSPDICLFNCSSNSMFGQSCIRQNSKVRLAILDSGIDLGNPNLMKHLNEGLSLNCVDPISNIDDDDPQKHGSFVGGIIERFMGINDELLIYKVLDKGPRGTIFHTIYGMDRAINAGANIINISLISPTNLAALGIHPLSIAINEAGLKGIVVFAAAGNNNNIIDTDPTVVVPAACANENLISVMSVGCESQKSLWSNNSKVSVDFAAYGENIISYGERGQLYTWSGTSFSVAMATSVGLQIWGNIPNTQRNPISLKNAMIQTCSFESSLRNMCVSEGILNPAKAAVTLLGNCNNQVPVVSIVSPSNNAVFTAPAAITINALATDPDGTISKIEFYNGTTLLNPNSTTSQSFVWSNVAAGTYSLTVKAYDNLGAVTISTGTTVKVNAPNKPPVVSITSPINNAVFTAPAAITINALATDPDGTISKIEFYNGTTLLNPNSTTSQSFVWSNVAAGTYSLTAKAYDNLGAVTTSAVTTVKVNAPNKPPVVSITSPINNAVFTAPAAITINASATDPDGTISKIEFYNGTTLLNPNSTTSQSFVWSNVAAGTYSLTAKAYDNLGAVTTSAVTTVKVNAPNKPPVVSITSPINNAVFTAPAAITINASATDPDGTISKIEFYNGATLLNRNSTTAQSFVWSNVAAGTYSLTVKAYDNLGAVTTSSILTVRVNIRPASYIGISVFPNPAQGSTTVSMASDNEGNYELSLFDVFGKEILHKQGVLQSKGDTTQTLDTSSLSKGIYAIRLKQYDMIATQLLIIN